MKIQPAVTSTTDPTPDPDTLIERGREVVRLEAQTIAGLEQRLDERFAAACREVLACEGQVVVSGMGKAGLIGQKISATLASTGTPSIFLHPGEALHGDLGRIRPQDLVLAISNSGWRVRSPSRTRLRSSNSTLPVPSTRTEPKGSSPASSASRASSTQRARCLRSSWLTATGLTP